MPSTPSEYKVEELIIQLLKLPVLLSTVSIVHADADTDAQTKRIIVKATRGNLRKDGPGGYDYTVDIMAKGLEGDQVTWDDWRAAIETRMQSAPVAPPAAYTAALAAFSFFMEPPELDESAERDRTDAIRTGTLTFQFIAKTV